MGIGYDRDSLLKTHRHVFGVLGPHSGNYGDIYIVFKREILHHPDANFTIQAATSYLSGNCSKWRPWFGTKLTSQDEQLKDFHASKLHAAVPGFEYAAALELIATASHWLGTKSLNISFEKVLEYWMEAGSHQVLEAHLPGLIPLDYIDCIYMTEKIYAELNVRTKEVIVELLGERIVKLTATDPNQYHGLIAETTATSH